MSLKTVDGREGAGAIAQPVDNFRAELTGAKDASFEAVRFLKKTVAKATSDALPTLLLKLDGSEDQASPMQNQVAKNDDNFGAPKGPRGFANERFADQVKSTLDNMSQATQVASSERAMESVEQAQPKQAQKPEFDLILV